MARHGGESSVQSVSGLTLSVLTDAPMNEPRFMILETILLTVFEVFRILSTFGYVLLTVFLTFEFVLSTVESPGKLLICLSFLMVRPPDFDFFKT